MTVDVLNPIAIPRTSETVRGSKRGPDTIQQFQDAGLGGVIDTTPTVVGTAAVLLPAVPQADRKMVIIENHSASITVYLGGADVTAVDGGGLKVAPGATKVYGFGPAALYGVTASGSATVCVAEIS